VSILGPPAWHLGTERERIAEYYRADESRVVRELLDIARLPHAVLERVTARARRLVIAVRERRVGTGGIDAFLHEYALSSEEGVVLMCLAEALLRIPDADTADRLIRDKLGTADWEHHIGRSDSAFVNASTWALMLTGRIVNLPDYQGQSWGSVLSRLVGRIGEPVIRQSVTQAMRILGQQFVMGRRIDEALERSTSGDSRRYRHSFDMLGEAACTDADAQRYFEAYRTAIDAIGATVDGRTTEAAPSISVKLSALHPRFEYWQHRRVLQELAPRLHTLADLAAKAGIGLTVDAEEADRLDLTLDLFADLVARHAGTAWQGLGIVVQTYQKRALPLIDWLTALARQHRVRLAVRLVKGAYWDTEIKRAQERGLDGYPVFTRKAATDICFLACARRLLERTRDLYPQFATHNAHAVASVIEMAPDGVAYEFQRLHGMGEALYDQIVGGSETNKPCRVYAPVGNHEELLAYLVRRLLENGANTSFVNRIIDEDIPVENIIANPLDKVRSEQPRPHPRIPLPVDLYGPDRKNSVGIDLSDPLQLAALDAELDVAMSADWVCAPIVAGTEHTGPRQLLHNPSDRRQIVGHAIWAKPDHVNQAMQSAAAAQPSWDAAGGTERARCLNALADRIERDTSTLMALAVREAGKTVNDALLEVREAVDFCRYYAVRAQTEFAAADILRGPTGEHNELKLHGRGVFACISPWNFPLAIFTGQIAAALAAGNTVVAKPAEQTPLIACHTVRLMHAAGVPADVVHVLPGPGNSIGAQLIADPRVAGVAFTGSTDTARRIQRALTEKAGPIVPLIAETGGQNAMIVDSSALPEQVVGDVIASAFQSAGQRCSALRVLFVQQDIAPKLLDMLAGAMAELQIGDPALLATDLGPVIDDAAVDMLNAHAERMRDEAHTVYCCDLPEVCRHGTFFAPCAFEITSIDVLRGEVFGPILHVVRYRSDQLDAVIDSINATGFGLTLGIHSRIDATIQHICERAKVGNIYVNRNQIGAVVGVQPFGGEGLSGTGPKAGGPHYMHRFATERTLSINTTAQGGNTELMSLQDDPDPD